MIEVWRESTKSNTSQRLAGQTRLILKKRWMSEVDVVEIMVNRIKQMQREQNYLKHNILKTKSLLNQ